MEYQGGRLEKLRWLVVGVEVASISTLRYLFGDLVLHYTFRFLYITFKVLITDI